MAVSDIPELGLLQPLETDGSRGRGDPFQSLVNTAMQRRAEQRADAREARAQAAEERRAAREAARGGETRKEQMSRFVDEAATGVFSMMRSKGVNIDAFLDSEDRLQKQATIQPFIKQILDQPKVRALSPEARRIYVATFVNRLNETLLSPNYTPLPQDVMPSGPAPESARNILAARGVSTSPGMFGRPAPPAAARDPLRAAPPPSPPAGGVTPASPMGGSYASQTDPLRKYIPGVDTVLGGLSNLGSAFVDAAADLTDFAGETLAASFKDDLLQNRAAAIGAAGLGYLADKARVFAKMNREVNVAPDQEAAANRVGEFVYEGDYLGALNQLATGGGAVVWTGDMLGTILGSGGVARAGAGAVLGVARAVTGSTARLSAKTSAAAVVAGASAAQAQAGAQEVYDSVKSMDPEVVKQTPAYMRAEAALPDYATHEQILELAAETQKNTARVLGFGVGLISGRIGNVSESIFLGASGVLRKLATGSAAKSAARTAGREALSEAVEEGSLAAIAGYLPTQRLEDIDVGRVAASAAFGATIGGVVGGALGGASEITPAGRANAAKMDEALNEAIAQKFRDAAAQGDPVSQELIDNAVEVEQAFTTLFDVQAKAQAEALSDQSNALNSFNTLTTAEVALDATLPQDFRATGTSVSALMSDLRAGDVSALTGPELRAVALNNRLDDTAVTSDPTGKLDGVAPDLRASVVASALEQRLTDLNAPLIAKGTFEERTSAIAEAMQREGLSTGNLIPLSQALAAGGFSANAANNNKLFKDILRTSPELAPDINMARRYINQQQAVKRSLSQLRKAIKTNNSSTKPELTEQGRDVLRQQRVEVTPKVARTLSNPTAILQAQLDSSDGEVRYTTPTGKASIRRIKGKNAFEQARDIGKENKERDSGVRRIFKTSFEAGDGVFNTAGAMLQKMGMLLDDVMIIKRLENTASEGAADPLEFRAANKINIYDKIMRARVLFGRAVADARVKYAQPALEIEDELIAETGLDGKKVRNMLTKMVLANNVPERAVHKMVRRVDMLNPAAKLQVNDINDKIANTDGSGPALYAQMVQIFSDSANYLDPKTFAPVSDIKVDITTEFDADGGVSVSANIAEAQELFDAVVAQLGPRALEYKDLIVQGHRAALEVRIASGQVDQRTARILRAQPNDTYVMFRRKNKAGKDVHDGMDGDYVSYRNRAYRQYKGEGSADNPLRSALGVMEDHLVTSHMSALEAPVIEALANMGELLAQRGMGHLIEVREARAPLLDTESGLYVHPDLPTIDQTNVFLNRRGAGNNRLVVVRDDRLDYALNRIWGDPVNRRLLDMKPGKLETAARAAVSATRTMIRGTLIGPEYLLVTGPTRDVRESVNEIARKEGFKGIGKGAWVAAQSALFNSKDLATYLWAAPQRKPTLEAAMRAKAKANPDNKGLGYLLEMLDEGALLTFGQELGEQANSEAQERSRVRTAMRAISDKVDSYLQKAENIQTFSDTSARMITYAAMREGGASPEAAAAVTRGVMNFAQQPGFDGKLTDSLAMLFPFYRSGLIGASKLGRSVWIDERAPTETRVLEDGSVVPYLDRGAVMRNIAWRPIMMNTVKAMITMSMVLAAADATIGDDEREGAGDTPPGAAGLDPNQLLASIPFMHNYDPTTGRIDITGTGNAYGFAPMMGLFGAATVLLASGKYDPKDIKDGVVAQVMRNISPVGDMGLDQLFEGDHIGFLREMFNAATPELVQPIGELLVNQDDMGNPIFDESSDSRGRPLAVQDPKTGGRMVERGVPGLYRYMFGDGAEETRHLLEGYLGSAFTVLEELGTGVMNQLGNSGLSTELQKDELASVPGRTVATNAYFLNRQYSKLRSRFWDPTADHIADLKEQDGTRADPDKVGPLERAWRRNNEDVYHAFTRINAYSRARDKLNDEIMDLQDDFTNPVKMDELLVRRKELQKELITYLGDKYPELMESVLD